MVAHAAQTSQPRNARARCCRARRESDDAAACAVPPGLPARPYLHGVAHTSILGWSPCLTTPASGSCTCTPTPTTSPARAQRRRGCTSTRASTCTSSPVPEVNADRCSTRRWTVPRCSRTSPRSAARRWSGPRDPGRHPGLARLRRLRLARGRPAAAAARGLLRPGAARGGGRAAGPADPVVPPARGHHVRREGRVPAPRPHQVPRDLGGRRRGGRRPGALPRGRRAVAGAEALLPARLQPAEGVALHEAAQARASTRSTASGSRSGSPTRPGTPASPPGCRAGSTSRSATGH